MSSEISLILLITFIYLLILLCFLTFFLNNNKINNSELKSKLSELQSRLENIDKNQESISDANLLSLQKIYEKSQSVSDTEITRLTEINQIRNILIQFYVKLDELSRRQNEFKNDLEQKILEEINQNSHNISRFSEKLLEISNHQNEIWSKMSVPVLKLESILGGHAQTRGAAGENYLKELLRTLPAEWVAYNIPFDGYPNERKVEFALRLPTGKLIPIDSKWVVGEFFEELDNVSDNPEEWLKLQRRLGAAVVRRSLEVQKYLDPHRTMGFVIATIPDGIFDYCRSKQSELLANRVLLVSYSQLVPVLLIFMHHLFVTPSMANLSEKGYQVQRELFKLEKLAETLNSKVGTSLNSLKYQSNEIEIRNSNISAVIDEINELKDRLQSLQSRLPVQIPLSKIQELYEPHEKILKIIGEIQNSFLTPSDNLEEESFNNLPIGITGQNGRTGE